MSTVRDRTPFEVSLQELLNRTGSVLENDTDRMLQIAALQSRVYAEVDAVLRAYIRERDEILTGYRSHTGEQRQ